MQVNIAAAILLIEVGEEKSHICVGRTTIPLVDNSILFLVVQSITDKI